MATLFELLWKDKMTKDIIKCGFREVSVEAVVRYLANPENIDDLNDHLLSFVLFKTYGVPQQNVRTLIERCLWYMNNYPGVTEDGARGSSAGYSSGISAFDNGHGSEYNKHAASGSCLAGPSRTTKKEPSFERNYGSSSWAMQLADSSSDMDVIVLSSDDSDDEVASEERSRQKKIPKRRVDDSLLSHKRNSSGPLSPKKKNYSQNPKRANIVISDDSDVEKPVPPVKTKEISNESGSDSDEPDAVYEVVDILDHRVTRRGITEYRVQWKLGPRGEYWSDSENWVAESRMMCPDILKKYKCEKGIHDKTKTNKSRRNSSVSSSDDYNHRTLTRKELEAKRFRERRANTKLLIFYDKEICTTSDEDAGKRKRPAEDVVDMIEGKQRGRRARPNCA